ncbi:MAG TPA: hypothetical protein PKK06_02080 [Phycisphaerae bacterium]|nr:hypothetical protein [Phycisphaerae bacterium]HNU44086.1 hypothetical protein [Phycisphaerae bacterium]
MWARLLILAPIVLTAAGCHQPQAEMHVSVVRVPGEAPAADCTDALWQAVQDTLRAHRFTLDRVDWRAGVITTLPEASQHTFEVWRRDVATWYDFAEATVNPVRRWVEVTVSHDPEQPARALSVVVHKQRLSSPDRQFNCSGAAYRFFAENTPSTTGIARITEGHDRWVDRGRDPALEEYLLRQTLKRAGISMPEAVASTAPLSNPTP